MLSGWSAWFLWLVTTRTSCHDQSIAPIRPIAGLHADRAPGRDRDHRRVDRPALAGGAGGREAARRAQCTNNLKQITLAIANYVDVNNVTPLHEYRYATENGGTNGNAGTHSWFCGIAPYLEQTTMYNSINFSYTVEWAYSGVIIGPNPIDFTVNKASIATLLCPSDGVVNTCSGYAQYINYQPGNFNYVANTGHPRNVLLPGDPPNTGTLPPLTGIISMSQMYLGQIVLHSRCQIPTPT